MWFQLLKGSGRLAEATPQGRVSDKAEREETCGQRYERQSGSVDWPGNDKEGNRRHEQDGQENEEQRPMKRFWLPLAEDLGNR